MNTNRFQWLLVWSGFFVAWMALLCAIYGCGIEKRSYGRWEIEAVMSSGTPLICREAFFEGHWGYQCVEPGRIHQP